jgi:hypothetical protein
MSFYDKYRQMRDSVSLLKPPKWATEKQKCGGGGVDALITSLH